METEPGVPGQAVSTTNTHQSVSQSIHSVPFAAGRAKPPPPRVQPKQRQPARKELIRQDNPVLETDKVPVLALTEYAANKSSLCSTPSQDPSRDCQAETTLAPSRNNNTTADDTDGRHHRAALPCSTISSKPSARLMNLLAGACTYLPVRKEGKTHPPPSAVSSPLQGAATHGTHPVHTMLYRRHMHMHMQR